MTDSTAPAIRPPAREIRVVEDVIPILDTARFEHIQRIAGAIAQGSLIPETLRGVHKGSGNNRTLEPFEHQMVVANVFRIVNQAVRWGMDPFAVIDCCSVVHGRLMYEGKLIHAVIEARTGIRLKYTFGRMIEVENSTGGKIQRFDPSEEGAGVFLAVQISGQFEDEDEPRTIEGTVEQWKTTGAGNPWGDGPNYKRQMRYRGAREWARAHSPGTILGVVTDDEQDADVERQVAITSSRRTGREKTDLRGKLAAPAAAAGFSAEHVASETATAADGTEHDADTGEVIEGTVVDKKQAALDARAQALELAQIAGKTAEAFGAADDGPGYAELLKDAKTDEERGYIENGWKRGVAERAAAQAEDGENTQHAHEDASENPTDEEDELEELRRLAHEDGYNGEPVEAILSECEEDEEKRIATEAHAAGVAQKIADLAAEGGAIGTEETVEEPFPGDPKPADFEDVAGPAPKDEKYLLASEEPDASGQVQLYVNGKPFSQVPADKAAGRYKRYDGHPEPTDPALASQGDGKAKAKPKAEPKPLTFAERLAAKASWHEIKTELAPLYGSEDFKALDPADQARTRANIFEAVLEMKERTKDPVDWGTDPTAFGLFADHTALGGDKDAADMIEGTFATLQASDGWKRLNEAQQGTMTQRVAAMVKTLR